MEKYLLFGGEFYYAKGGLNDFHGSGWNAEWLKEYAELQEFDWYHIIDRDTLEVVYKSQQQAYGVYDDDRVPD